MVTIIPPRVENVYQLALYLMILWVAMIVLIWFTYPEENRLNMISIFAGLIVVTMFFYIIGKMRSA